MPRVRYGTDEAAELCGREGSHIRRLCKQLGLGKLSYSIGRKRWLTKTELTVLVKHVRDNGSDGRSRGRRAMKS
jgi:hypothetical protein